MAYISVSRLLPLGGWTLLRQGSRQLSSLSCSQHCEKRPRRKESIRSVRRVRPIRRRFHHDPARMSEISAARWEGQMPREGPRSCRNFEPPRTRQDMCKAGPAVACTNRVYVRDTARQQAYSTHFQRCDGLAGGQKGAIPCLGGSCSVVSSPGRSRKKAMCSMWVANQSQTGQTGKRRGGGVAPRIDR